MYELIRNRFFEGINEGQFRHWNSQEIDQLTAKMFSNEPLQELGLEDQKVIYQAMRELIESYINRTMYSQLANDNAFFFRNGREIPEGINATLSTLRGN